MIPPRFRTLIDEVRPVADGFTARGHTLYLVGGIVRDVVLGRERDDLDLDFTTDAPPGTTLDIVRSLRPEAVWTQGERFGTIGARIGGRAVEITTHRAEAYSPDSRKPDVVFSTDIEADLSRRDFTINAMALRLPDPELIDPFGGMDDLVARRLRTPLDPAISFSDDPLRMLRAARFLAGLDLEADAALVDAVTSMAQRLTIVSTERIRDEFDKLMVVDRPGRGLWFVVDTGLADHFFPELPAMHFEQDPVHRHKDVLTHTIAVVENTSPERILRLAALYHDIAKPATKAIGPQGVTFHHHDMRGAKMTRKRMRALLYANDDIDAVSQLVALHLRVHTYGMGWTDSAVRRYVRDAGPLLDRLNELQRCDCTTRNPRKAAALARRMDELEERIAALRDQEELDAIRPDLDGNDVMAILGVAPGRVIGEALSMLLEIRLDEGPLGRDEAERRLLAWWSERSG